MSKSESKEERNGGPSRCIGKQIDLNSRQKVDMEECRRTRSQGPPSLLESDETRQWGSLPDPLQIERKHTEALRLARQVNTGLNMNKTW